MLSVDQMQKNPQTKVPPEYKFSEVSQTFINTRILSGLKVQLALWKYKYDKCEMATNIANPCLIPKYRLAWLSHKLSSQLFIICDPFFKIKLASHSTYHAVQCSQLASNKQLYTITIMINIIAKHIYLAQFKQVCQLAKESQVAALSNSLSCKYQLKQDTVKQGDFGKQSDFDNCCYFIKTDT